MVLVDPLAVLYEESIASYVIHTTVAFDDQNVTTHKAAAFKFGRRDFKSLDVCQVEVASLHVSHSEKSFMELPRCAIRRFLDSTRDLSYISDPLNWPGYCVRFFKDRP